MKSKPKPSTLKPLDFGLLLKAPNSYLNTRTYQSGLAEEAVALLIDHYDTYALSIGFPELAVPAVLLVCYFKNNEKKKKMFITDG